MTEYTFLSADTKSQIHVCEWQPKGTPRAVVQLAHGIAEHIERYADFAEYLNSRGFLVAGNDHLGHGKTAENGNYGHFGDTAGWELALADMRMLTRRLRERFPDTPIFLLGHSMGSFLSRTYIIKFPGALDGVILSGTGQMPAATVEAGIRLAELEIRRYGAAHQSKLINKVAFGGYNRGFDIVRTMSDWISSDEAVVDAYLSDPACGFIPSAGLFRDMLGGIKFICQPRNLARMEKSLPVFFFAGDKDPVGESGKGVMRAYTSFLGAGMQDVTLKLYAGGRHEMLNERSKAQVYTDVADWIDIKLK